MFIALEGPDGAGKSTLAQAIADATPGTEIVHFSQLKQNPLDEYVYAIEDYTPGKGGNLVTDRWHIGEDIYGPLYRGESGMTSAQRRWIELWGLSRGATLFHVTQPLDELRRRLSDRGEDFLKPEDIERVHTEFFAETAASPLYSESIEPSGDLSATVESMLALATYNEASAEVLTPFTSYVGRTIPSVLLVHNPTPDTDERFAPYTYNASAFLLDSLSAEVWPTVGLCDASVESERLEELVDTLAGPRVIALGRDASDILLDQGIEHAGVPEPRYVQDFHSKKIREYGVLISDVLRGGDVRFSWPSR